jgi:phosphatidylinositol 4-kinase
MHRVESAFGEVWTAKKERLLGDRYQPDCDEDTAIGGAGMATGGFTSWPCWDLRSFIVKSNDDLRQEVCCLQLMVLCKEVFIDFGLGTQLWLKPYRIISTGSSTGIVEVLNNTMSLDSLKKTPNFVSLPQYFKATYGSSPERLTKAKRNFAASLAAYSLFCYILSIKDRHNGNMLIDTEGHIIHIDFGFLLSIAPGGAFSLETAPFKLTEEMVEVLGGLESQLFGEFVKAFTAGFLALRANSENIVTSLHVLSLSSPFPCFVGKDSSQIIERLRSRFRCDLSVKETVQHCLDLIISSYGHMGTRQYDSFQWYTNGIMP